MDEALCEFPLAATFTTRTSDHQVSRAVPLRHDLTRTLINAPGVIHENLVAVMKSLNFSRLFAASFRFIDQFIVALVGERRPFRFDGRIPMLCVNRISLRAQVCQHVMTAARGAFMA
jgi:hypothetical protein